jgi:hypothetical protein
MSLERDSVLECASVLALFRDKRHCQLESAKTLAHSKTLSRSSALFSIQMHMVLWSYHCADLVLQRFDSEHLNSAQ